jgi:hypothetical protein
MAVDDATKKSILLIHPLYNPQTGKVVVYHLSGKMEFFTKAEAKAGLAESNKPGTTRYFEMVLEAFPTGE